MRTRRPMNKDQTSRDERCLAPSRIAARWNRPTGMTSRSIGSREPSPVLWIADPLALYRVCQEAVRTLTVLPADTPSLRLLADEAAKALAGIQHVLDGLALLVDAPHQPSPDARDFRLGEPDWLPALTNAARAFLAITAVELFWVATAWPRSEERRVGKECVP